MFIFTVFEQAVLKNAETKLDEVTVLTFCGVEVLFPCRWALCIVGWETGLPSFGRGGVLPQVSSEFCDGFLWLLSFLCTLDILP